MFKKGQCCYKNPFGDLCDVTYVSLIANTDLSYCRLHYKSELNKHKLLVKTQLLNEKNKRKEELNNKKNELLLERIKLFELKNTTRASKGLPPLKKSQKNTNKIYNEEVNNEEKEKENEKLI